MPIQFENGQFQTPDGKTCDLRTAAQWSDFARARGIQNIIPSDFLAQNAPRTQAILEKACEILGCDAVVTSFYRGPQLNGAVGGHLKPPSAHTEGRAVDWIPRGVTLEEAFGVLRARAHDLGFDQLIIEHDRAGHEWLHLAVEREGASPRLMAFALEKGAETNRVAAG